MRGNACYTLMTSPSWLASWAIFHRLSSVAVERPPPIPSPSSLMYTTLTQWMISDIASLGWSKDNIMWPLITPLTTPPPSKFPHKPPFSFRIAWCSVYGYLSHTVWAENWAGLTRAWYLTSHHRRAFMLSKHFHLTQSLALGLYT